MVLGFRTSRWAVAHAVVLLIAGCGGVATDPEGGDREEVSAAIERPALMLVTLDTTRADHLESGRGAEVTPSIQALAGRGLRFTQAYSTTPTTLPAHASMLTGLYPAEHGLRENGRRLREELALLPEQLIEHGYTTAAFVSGFPLDSRFGLARGFGHYDDDFGGERVERSAAETTDRTLAYLASEGEKGDRYESTPSSCPPFFLWVHYFDPHDPYEPPEPWASRFSDDPYLGEIAAMDQEIGRLVEGFESQFDGCPWRLVVVGDHGEGRGDHGEALHGNLLYQGVMRVPLIVAGSDIAPGEIDRAVSVRDLHATLLGWANGEPAAGILSDSDEPILAEALKPYLQYGWQPQFMAVQNSVKVIRSGDTEIYDVVADPEEKENLVGRHALDAGLSRALADYADRAMAKPDSAAGDLGAETRAKLASLGYVAGGSRPALRPDAPNPREMAHLYHDLDLGAGLFIRREYAQAIPVFERVLAADPENPTVALRLAVAHSVEGEPQQAMHYFERARTIDPSSLDLLHYQAMHYLRYGQWEEATPLFEAVLATMPDRLPALEGLAEIYTRQGRIEEAIGLLERVIEIKESPGLELARLGELRMARGETAAAIRAFERAGDLLGDDFTNHLELGVLYLANRQLDAAAASLDRVSTAHPGYPMALFKRAQVSVLLAEPDREHRVRAAWAAADAATRPLIENEQLFRDIAYR